MRRGQLRSLVLAVGVAFMATLVLLPFWWVMSSSIKEPTEIISINPTMVPHSFTLQHFEKLLPHHDVLPVAQRRGDGHRAAQREHDDVPEKPRVLDQAPGFDETRKRHGKPRSVLLCTAQPSRRLPESLGFLGPVRLDQALGNAPKVGVHGAGGA